MPTPLSTHFRSHTVQEASGLAPGEAVTLVGHCLGRLNDAEPHFDLWDRYGTLRVHFQSDDPTVGRQAMEVGPEDVVQILGVVGEKAKDQSELIQVHPTAFKILNKARGLPLDPRSGEMSEDAKLRFRHLALREKLLQDRLQVRGLLTLGLRRHLHARGFLEIETPALAPITMSSTGIFPVAAGKFDCYGLSSTTQVYKQLLMMGGADRSFQFARCFRQEADYGPWHQPEFTALDIEMSYVNEGDIYREVDRLMGVVLASVGRSKDGPIQRLTWAEAMDRFGSDRPDCRYGLELRDVTAIAGRSHSAVIRALMKGGQGPGSAVKAIRITQAEVGKVGEELLNSLSQAVTGLRGVGVSWLRVEGEKSLSGPLARGFSEMLSEDLISNLGAETGEIIVMVISTHGDVASIAGGRVRSFLGEKLGLANPGDVSFVWVHQIPFFAYSPRGDCFIPNRHPFTAVVEEDMVHVATLEAHRRGGAPEKEEGDDSQEALGGAFDALSHPYGEADTEARRSCRSKGFELLLNGEEIGTGSIRNHDPAMQRRIFKLLDYDDVSIDESFGFILRALGHGTPPHGGLAIGFDRLVSILLHADSIRAVLPFPKDERGRCLTTGAPRHLGAEHVQALLGIGPLDPTSVPTEVPASIDAEEEEAPALEAAFTLSKSPIYVGESISFVDLSQSFSPITDWLWSCPKIKWRSTAQRPRKTFTAPGEYPVTLTVMNADRLRASAKVIVVVNRLAGIPRSAAR